MEKGDCIFPTRRSYKQSKRTETKNIDKNYQTRSAAGSVSAIKQEENDDDDDNNDDDDGVMMVTMVATIRR